MIKPTFVLLGPTGAGKSDVAFRLASLLDGEIISADSVQVYKGLDKGTAKPGPAQCREIPHHLLSIVDPAVNYCVAQFIKDARESLKQIRKRGKTPIIAGGTMLYIHSLLYGIADLPPSQETIRSKYRARMEEEDENFLHRTLQQLDEAAARSIHPHDHQRLLRALEVMEQSGEPLSALRQQARNGGIKEEYADGDEQLFSCALLFHSRELLHQRIKRRFLAFIENGFADEVRELRKRADLSLECSSMRAVGYRQIWEHLDGKYGYEKMLEKGLTATRRLAKNQRTWLRSWKKHL